MAQMMGWQKYLNIRKETTWGTYDSGGTSIYIPVADYSVGVAAEFSQAALFTGIRQRKHNRFLWNTLSGNLSCPLWGIHSNSKSIAQHLIEWSTNGPTTAFVDAYSCDLYDAGNDDKRHLGCRVNTMTIAGDAQSGNISISLAIIGKEESGGVTNPSLSATAPLPIDFVFSDVDFYLSDESEGESASSASESVSIRNFSITFNNNLQVYHTDDQWPSVIVAGVRTVDFAFEVFKEDDTYDALRRTSGITTRAGHLSMTCPHGGSGASGTNTTIDVYFDALNFSGASDAGGLNDLVSQSTSWAVLKPATTENEIEFAFGLA